MALIDKISILNIKDKGTLASEYVVLKVHQNTDLLHFALVDSTYNDDGSFSNRHKHFYKFYPTAVKAGDFIHLYTKGGKDDTFSNTSKTTTHRFYWNLKTSVWNNDGDLAVLYSVEAWSTFDVKSN